MTSKVAPIRRLRVNEDRLLKELPRFFESFEEALTELVQNAYRAGAQQITLTLDTDARTLEVIDTDKRQ